MTTENAPAAVKAEEVTTQPAGSSAEETQKAKDNSAAAQARIAFDAKEAKYKADLAERDKELAALRNKGKSADELLAERNKEVEQYGKERETLAKERDTYRSYADEALKPRVDALPKELQDTLGLIGDYEAKLKALKNFEAVAKTSKPSVQGGVVPNEGPLRDVDWSALDVMKHGASAMTAIAKAKQKYGDKAVEDGLRRYEQAQRK